MPVENSRDFMKALGRYKMLILAFTAAGGLASAAAAFLMTPKYRAEVKLVVVEPGSAGNPLAELMGQFGGLAALAGMNLTPASTKQESFAYLRSGALLRKFIEQERLMPVLFAKKWDRQAGKWKTSEAPTLNQGVKKLRQSVVGVQEDRRTGVVTLGATWSDRELVARWANGLVALANEALRRQAVQEADRSIAYLSAQARQAVEVELRQSLYKVMESQINSSVLARARSDYAYRIIDPAVVPDARDRASPKRLLMILLGIAFGTLVGLAVAASRLALSSGERQPTP